MPSSTVQKVVPVITRRRHQKHELLVFQHPTEAVQLVKGTVEPGEELEAAALRELEEESGVKEAVISTKIGEKHFEFKDEKQHWHFYSIEVSETLRDQWDHFAQEEEGMWFKLFWQDIDEPLDTPWPEVFDAARRLIRDWLARVG